MGWVYLPFQRELCADRAKRDKSTQLRASTLRSRESFWQSSVEGQCVHFWMGSEGICWDIHCMPTPTLTIAEFSRSSVSLLGNSGGDQMPRKKQGGQERSWNEPFILLTCINRIL